MLLEGGNPRYGDCPTLVDLIFVSKVNILNLSLLPCLELSNKANPNRMTGERTDKQKKAITEAGCTGCTLPKKEGVMTFLWIFPFSLKDFA